MQVIKMIGSIFGTAQTNMVKVCKSMVKSTPSKPMKNPRANSSPFLDLNKSHVTTIDVIINPKIDGADAKNKKTWLTTSDISPFFNCQASIRTPAMVAKILVMIMRKQRDN